MESIEESHECLGCGGGGGLEGRGRRGSVGVSHGGDVSVAAESQKKGLTVTRAPANASMLVREDLCPLPAARASLYREESPPPRPPFRHLDLHLT
ncbi:hypothetical protein E2C01_094703 [Portunus trituberculatus]|uniref:Uncharacterized protein n=1 Tax=Portunus trituberculatus TaxID=210409 RepID=A0A5B7K1J9_PORTR|nr:hypothetical protein [Portunus trituberculatus]